MKFSEVARKSLASYRTNPVLCVPPLVALIMSILTSMIPPQVSEGFPAFTPSLLAMGFGVLFLNLVVNFLVILGQATMSGKAVSEGKTKVADWGTGVRRYFLKVLGIGLVFLGIVLVLFVIAGVVYALSILPKLLTPEGVITSSTAALTPPPAFTLAMTFLFTVAQAVFYVWLAPAILDDKGVGTSIDMGVKAIRTGVRVFVGFIALFFVVSAIVTLISDLPIMIDMTVQPLVGSLTPTRLVSLIIEKISSPLWFLIAFTLYHEKST